MLSFATEFPVGPDRTTQDFLSAIQTWILGSPHTCLTSGDISALLADAEGSIRKENESVALLRVDLVHSQIAAVKYCRIDGGLQWATNVVFSRRSSDSWVGTRVSCESPHPAARLPAAKKPVIIRTLLDRLGGGTDGELDVSAEPIYLSQSDIDLAGRLIKGGSGIHLPVVYVSIGFGGSYLVDCARLATSLAGMAHVVVEPNRPFSLRLKLEVESENVYGGTIGVYWPDGGGRRSFFIGQSFDSPDEVARALFEEIRTALTNRRALDRCTWSYVQEARSRQALDALKASGSQEIEKYIETFDEEIRAKNERIQEAEKEIDRLRAEIRSYEARLPAGTGSPLRTGGEQDLYTNEIFNILRDAVEDAYTRVPLDSRRQHVLDALLQANPARESVAAINRQRLKQLLRGSRGMSADLRRGLEDMGFVVSDDGKHYKLVFRGDDRYTFSLQKSGSDHRGGLNAAGDIGRLLF